MREPIETRPPSETLTATDIAELARNLRRSSGLTQEAAAYRYGVPLVRVQRMEQGVGLGAIVEGLRLLEGLGCELRVARREPPEARSHVSVDAA